MRRYTRKRIGIWFAVLVLLLSSTPVYASDCSDPTDCKNTIAGWVMIAVAIAAVIVLITLLPEILAAAGIGLEVGEGVLLAGAEGVEGTGVGALLPGAGPWVAEA